MANGLHRLKLWAAQNAKMDSSSPTDPDTQTVTQATAGMTPKQKDVWLNLQIEHAKKDMKAKGIPVDVEKIGPNAFVNDVDTGVNRVTNGIEVDPADVDNLTVAEFRSALAHEVRHTQQWKVWLNANPVAGEQDADFAAVKTYGAKIYNRTLDKLYAGVANADIDDRYKDRNDPDYDPRAPITQRKKDNLEYERQLNSSQDKALPDVRQNFSGHSPSFSP